MELALRQRLRRVVLDSDTRAGRIYNLVIFGTILLSVAGLFMEPHPMRVADSGEIQTWVGEFERGCLLVFMADYLLHLWVSPKPLVYARSFLGLIDLSAVLFFFVPQISSGLILWFSSSAGCCGCSNCCGSWMRPSCWAGRSRPVLAASACSCFS